MSDLGITRKEMWGGCEPCGPSDDYEKQKVYPCLNLAGAQVEIAGLENVQFGEEMTFTVKVRVSRVGGQSAEDQTPEVAFDVLEIEGDGAGAKRSGGLAGAYQKAMK